MSCFLSSNIYPKTSQITPKSIVDKNLSSYPYDSTFWSLPRSISGKLHSFITFFCEQKDNFSIGEILVHIYNYAFSEGLYEKEKQRMFIIVDDELQYLLSSQPFEKLTFGNILNYILPHFNLPEIIPKIIKINKNEYGNYEHYETNLIFDSNDRKVFAKQIGAYLLPLSQRDLNICEKYSFKYKLHLIKDRDLLRCDYIHPNGTRCSRIMQNNTNFCVIHAYVRRDLRNPIDQTMDDTVLLSKQFLSGNILPKNKKITNDSKSKECIDPKFNNLSPPPPVLKNNIDFDNLPPLIINAQSCEESKEEEERISKEENEMIVDEIVSNLVNQVIKESVESLKIETLSTTEFITLDNPSTNTFVNLSISKLPLSTKSEEISSITLLKPAAEVLEIPVLKLSSSFPNIRASYQTIEIVETTDDDWVLY